MVENLLNRFMSQFKSAEIYGITYYEADSIAEGLEYKDKEEMFNILPPFIGNIKYLGRTYISTQGLIFLILNAKTDRADAFKDEALNIIYNICTTGNYSIN